LITNSLINLNDTILREDEPIPLAKIANTLFKQIDKIIPEFILYPNERAWLLIGSSRRFIPLGLLLCEVNKGLKA